jgi:acetyl-CoA C-acetyltransferase
MTSAVIVSTARTPLAKSWKGAFNMTHGATLGGHAVQHAIQRAGIEAAEVDDVIMGCATPEGATGSNIARQIALAAGCPVTVSGMTINRFCSSGLQTIATAAQRIISGEGEVYVAGGVESISCVQNEANRHMITDPALLKAKPEIYWNMLQTAEQVAKRYNIGRDAMDAYGAASQQKACAAQAACSTPRSRPLRSPLAWPTRPWGSSAGRSRSAPTKVCVRVRPRKVSAASSPPFPAG